MTNNRHIPLLISLVLIFAFACGIAAPAALENPPSSDVISTSTIAATNTAPATKQPITATQTPEGIICTVTALQSLNLRAEPSDKSAADRDGLRNGDKVTLKFDDGQGWLFVETGDGRCGWVKKEYVSCDEE